MLLCGLKARFSDTEDDASSRAPADAKQVHRASQRSKVSGHGGGGFERTDALHPTDPAVLQLTVSKKAASTQRFQSAHVG